MNNLERSFERTEFLLGKEAMDKLKESHVAIFGLGGVGSYAVETLVRSGLGEISIIDYAKIDVTNINRQIQANINTLGMDKIDAIENRIKSINPDMVINKYRLNFGKDNYEEIDFRSFDYVIDAIDTITSKLILVEICKARSIPIIAAMGFGNKLDPTKIQVADIYDTKIDPLARVIRRELRSRGVDSLKCVYSTETPMKINIGDLDKRKAIPASTAFVPPVGGITLAAEVVKDLIKER